MTHLSDSHLEDPRWDRELRDEQAARELRDAAVLKRKKEILTGVFELERLITEHPITVAHMVGLMMLDDYEDHVPEFRKVIMRLAENEADQDTMSIDAFRHEKEESQ